MISAVKHYDPVALNKKLNRAFCCLSEGRIPYFYNGKKVSYEDYLSIIESSQERYEYINGQIFFLPSKCKIHKRICSILSSIFSTWFINRQEQPLADGFEVILELDNGDINLVHPDIMVISNSKEVESKGIYRGVPFLVIEVISDYTMRKDYINKLDLYLSAGVQEYWIVNPINKEVLIYIFKDKKIKRIKIFKDLPVRSFIYKGLEVDTGEIFGW